MKECNSIGYTTRAWGTPCWPAGIDAQTYDFGTLWNNDPEDLANSRYILLWGLTPPGLRYIPSAFCIKPERGAPKS